MRLPWEQREQSGRLPLDPEANHLDLLQEHLADLKQGKTIHIPIYNHATGKFDPPEPFAPTPIIVGAIVQLYGKTR